MLKVLFVCHGNICRSPLAEFLFKNKLKTLCLDAEVDSKATSYEEIGNPVYYAIVPYLNAMGADYKNKRAEKLTEKDGDYYDYIVVMDDNNLRNSKQIVAEKNHKKIFKLGEFTRTDQNVSDPWYTRDFDTCYKDIDDGLDAFIAFLKKKKRLPQSLELSAMAIVKCADKILTTNELIYGKAVRSLPKGHKEKDERVTQTAIRECYEETNVVVREKNLVKKLAPWSYEFISPTKKLIKKTIMPFFFEIKDFGDPRAKEERILSVDWMTVEDFIKECPYDNVIQSVKEAFNLK